MKRLLAALLLVVPLAAGAAEAIPTEQDPVAAKRAVDLSEQLRCLVCQNQSIAESNASLAADLRGQIREQIAQGRSDREIVDYMVQRYGDFVLYRPPFKASTLLLWLGPLLLLIAGLLLLARRLRRAPPPEPQLSDAERAQTERLLAGNDAKDAR